MSIYLGETKLSDVGGGGSGTELPVGSIYESIVDSAPTYGTWEKLADRCEFDNWKELSIQFNISFKATGIVPHAYVKDGVCIVKVAGRPYTSYGDGTLFIKSGLPANYGERLSWTIATHLTQYPIVFTMYAGENLIYFDTNNGYSKTSEDIRGTFVYPVNTNDAIYKAAADRIIHRWKRTA